MTTFVTVLEVADGDFVVTSLIERCPKIMMLRELMMNSLEAVICPLQSGPKVNLDWTLKETKNGQEARA